MSEIQAIDRIKEGTIKYIKELIGAKSVRVVTDYTSSIVSKDLTYLSDVECYSKNATKRYIINVFCTAGNNKISFYNFKGYAILNDNISIICDRIIPIFEDMDLELLEPEKNNMKFISFINGNTVHAFTFSDEKKHSFEFKGKIIPNSLNNGTFYSIHNNSVIEYSISSRKENITNIDDSVYFREKTMYVGRNDKEIVGFSFADRWLNNHGYVPRFDPNVAIISYSDGTRRLLVEYKDGKRVLSEYFNKLNQISGAVCLNSSEFEKEDPRNYDEGYYKQDNYYFIPGLTFEYSSGKQIEYINVKNDFHALVKTKKN